MKGQTGMRSRFPFLLCWKTQVCSKSVLGGNSIIKQQERGLISQVNIHTREKAFPTDSHSPPSVHCMAKAHATGLLTPGPNTAVLPEVYGGLPGCVRRHFMAAITFFLVVNTTVEAQSHITAPRHAATSNRVVTPLLVFTPQR